MKYRITGISQLTLEYKEGDKKSRHISTDFNLEVGNNVDKDRFFDKDNLPNADGSKALTHCLVHGLVANIHYAHEKGFINDAKHLRQIIAELERGFIQIPKISVENFGNK
jgi:hypothetical protein